MNIELSEATRSLVSKERQQLSELHSLILELDAFESELESLKTALKDLDGIFMVVISGEYNAGKSSLVNALLGQKVMTEGVTPTTDRVTIIIYGEESRIIEESSSLARREYPAEILKDLAFVDTPGTNAIIKEHQELTEHFIPRADLVLFVTSADRPFTESERKFLELIASWGKKVLIVINKMDIIESAQERQKIVDFVKEHARATLGSSPSIFTLKAKQAFNAKQENNLEKIKDSGIDKLEHFIENSLANNSRIKLKLLNPLGVAERIAKDFIQIIDKRQSLLEDDKKTLSEVDRQLMQYEKDTERELNNHMARIKNILLEVEKRGEIFFDETIRTRNVLNLMKTDRIKRDFESQVIKNVDKDIDLAISELVDWFLQRNLNLWEDMMSFVNQRRQAGNEKLIGEIGGRFQYDRDSLITKLKHNSEKVLENYDQDSEARKLANNLQNSVLHSGIGLVSGLGLGAAMVALFSGLALDITGIAIGTAVAGLGLFVIPRRRKEAKKNLHLKMQEVRDGLEQSLNHELKKELRKSQDKLKNAIEPYTRFVRSEINNIDKNKSKLEDNIKNLEQLKHDIESLENSEN